MLNLMGVICGGEFVRRSSRRDVWKEPGVLTAGTTAIGSSSEGTIEVFGASVVSSRLEGLPCGPRVKTRGYCRSSLRDC